MSHKHAKKRPKALSIQRECTLLMLALMGTVLAWNHTPFHAATDNESVCVALTFVGLDNGDPGTSHCVAFTPPVSSSSSTSSSASSVASSASSSAVTVADSSEPSQEGDGARRGTIERSTERMRRLIREWEEVHRAPGSQFPFTDVPHDAWYRNAAEWLWERGFLDDAFRLRPHEGATRAETAKLLVKMHGIVPGTFQRIHFNDVPRNTWFFGYIEEAARQGWMKGYDNCYGHDVCFTMPEMVITRAEAAALLVRALGLQWMGDAPRFADNGDGPWYVRSIQIAADHCVLQGDDGTSKVRPNDRVTRAELLLMVYRGLEERTYRNGCDHESSTSVDARLDRIAAPTLSFQDGIPSLETSIMGQIPAPSTRSIGACFVRLLPSAMASCIAEQSVIYGHAMLATLRMPGGEFIRGLPPSEPVLWVIGAVWIIILGRLLFLILLRLSTHHKVAPSH